MNLLKFTVGLCLLLIIACTTADDGDYGDGGDQGGDGGDQGGDGGDQGGDDGDQGGDDGDQDHDISDDYLNNIGVEWMVGGAEYVKHCASPKKGSVLPKKCRAGKKKSAKQSKKGGAAPSNPAIIGGAFAVVILGITVIVIGE